MLDHMDEMMKGEYEGFRYDEESGEGILSARAMRTNNR